MDKFNSLPVKTRLFVLIGVVIAGLIVLTAMSLYVNRETMLLEKQSKTRNVVEVASGVLEYCYALEQSGKLSRDEAQTQARTLLRNLRYDKSDYFWINDMSHKMIMHATNPKLDGVDLSDMKDGDGNYPFREFVNAVKREGAGMVQYRWPRPGEKEAIPKVSYVKGFAPWGWVVGSGIYVDDIDTQLHSQALQIGVVSALILGTLLFMSWLINRGILQQLGGEPGYAAAITREISTGNLTQQVEVQSNTSSLLGSLKDMQQRLATLFRDIHGVSSNLAQTAEVVADAARESSLACQNQARATSDMAASVEQLTASITEVAQLSNATAETSDHVAALSETGKHQVIEAEQHMSTVADTVRKASGRVKQLQQRSEEIGSIANVIKEIAEQTNLLALNAAIEAARAGEQGRGFAVVADEVRKLAERTAKATTEISSLIGAVQSDTQIAVDEMELAIPLVDQGSQLTKAASTTLEAIHNGANNSLSKVHKVADATKAQSLSASEISGHIEAIAQMAEEVSRTMLGTSQHALETKQIGNDLGQRVNYFKV